jgi:succinate-acetate transporter protein
VWLVTTSTRSRTATGNGRVAPRYAAREPVDATVSAAAAPGVLGLFGLFTATVLYGSALAGWWGGSGSPILIFPFTVMLGGLAQLVAALSALRARDALTAAVHGIWSGFWLAFGLYELLVTTRRLPLLTSGRGVAFDFGMWFAPLAAITAATALAAVARSLGLVAVLAPLAGASLFTAVGFTGGLRWSLTLAGWLFVVSAAAAWYLGTALLLESQHGRAVLPTGRRRSPA